MHSRALAVGALVVALIGCCCTTTARAATADASVARQTILVRGKPFFPIMGLDLCTAAQAAHARALGMNLIVNESCPAATSAGLTVLPISNRAVGGNGLVGWTFPDEPEGNGWTPATLATRFPFRRGSPDGLLSFVTTGGGFAAGAYRDPQEPQSVYGAFARLADVAGFDLYPLNHCHHDLSAVYNAQQTFIQLAGQMPTFQWIETGPLHPTYCGGFAMTPVQLDAETWLAIVGGARGIGFFTGTWTPAFNAFDVSPSIQHAIKRVSSLLSAVQTGLTGSTQLSDVNSPAIKLTARMADGKTYVFAVNASYGFLNAQMFVPGLDAASFRVFGEKRALPVSDSRFSDHFAPLAVHVYAQPRRPS